MSVRWTSPRPCACSMRCTFIETGAGDLKALQGDGDELRLRIGDYRIFFVHTADEAIEIRRVRHRREAYR